LFALSGNCQTTFPQLSDQQGFTKDECTRLIVGMNGKSINAGRTGFYSVKVTALEDIPSSRRSVYLPSGLSGELIENPS
jgi:hypothetical protein